MGAKRCGQGLGGGKVSPFYHRENIASLPLDIGANRPRKVVPVRDMSFRVVPLRGIRTT